MIIAFVTILVICLVHYSYADLRFRHRGGALALWLEPAAPPLVWIARLAMVIGLAGAISIAYFGPEKPVWIVIGVSMLIHFISLIVLETRLD